MAFAVRDGNKERRRLIDRETNGRFASRRLSRSPGERDTVANLACAAKGRLVPSSTRDNRKPGIANRRQVSRCKYLSENTCRASESSTRIYVFSLCRTRDNVHSHGDLPPLRQSQMYARVRFARARRACALNLLRKTQLRNAREYSSCFLRRAILKSALLRESIM